MADETAAASYSKLQTQKSEPFWILNVQLHTVVIDKDGVPGTKFMHRTTTRPRSEKQQHRTESRPFSVEKLIADNEQYATSAN